MMAMAAAGTGDNKRAAQELQNALALDENYIPSRIALARIALASDSPEQFEQHLEKLVELAPDNPDVILLQAAAKRNSGDMAAARDLAEKAFSIAPSTSTLIVLATYQEAAGDQEGALQRYGQWLDEHPEDMAPVWRYANSLQLASDWTRRGNSMTEVIKADPDNPLP